MYTCNKEPMNDPFDLKKRKPFSSYVSAYGGHGHGFSGYDYDGYGDHEDIINETATVKEILASTQNYIETTFNVTYYNSKITYLENVTK